MGESRISPAFPEIQATFGISKPVVGLLIVVFLIDGFEGTFFSSSVQAYRLRCSCWRPCIEMTPFLL